MIYFILATLIVCVTTLVVVSLRLRRDLRIVRGKHSRLQRKVARLLYTASATYYSRMYCGDTSRVNRVIDDIAPAVDDEFVQNFLDKVRCVPKSLFDKEASAVAWIKYRNAHLETTKYVTHLR